MAFLHPWTRTPDLELGDYLKCEDENDNEDEDTAEPTNPPPYNNISSSSSSSSSPDNSSANSQTSDKKSSDSNLLFFARNAGTCMELSVKGFLSVAFVLFFVSAMVVFVVAMWGIIRKAFFY